MSHGLDELSIAPIAENRGRQTVLGVRAFVFAGLVVAGWLLPQPYRAIVMGVGALGLPWLAWSRFFRERLNVSLTTSVGLGFAFSAAAWSVVCFLALLARTGISYWACALMMAVVCIVPGVSLDPRPTWTAASGARLRATVKSGTRAGAVVLVSGLVGCAALAVSFALAKRHGDTSGVFLVFWLGTIALYLPAFWMAYFRSRWPVGYLTVLLAVATYAHVFLRTPLRPLMNDELGHWGETQTILRTGRLFQPDSVVGIGPRYPGLETLAAPIVRLSGLPTMAIGQGLVFLLQIASLLGVAALARLIIRDHPRVVAVAMCVYAINPSILEIDGMFAYESFGVPLVIWSMYCVLRGAQRPAGGTQKAFGALSVVLIFDVIITHHLSSFVLGAILVLCAVCSLFRGPRGRRPPGEWAQVPVRSTVVGGAALVTVAGAAAWAVASHAPLNIYLGGQGTSAWQALKRLATGKGLTSSSTATNYDAQQSGTRGLFGGSLLPHYERIAAFVMQPLLLVWFLLGLAALWRARGGLRWAMLILGGLYFASLPLTLINGASSGAHRSWGYSYIGLALCLAVTMAPGPPDSRARPVPAHSAARVTPRLLAIAVLVVALLGNYASAVNAYQRLPGPFVLNVDGRTITSDVVRSAEWFAKTQGWGKRILTTVRVRSVFGAYADTQLISYPGWEVLFPVTPPADYAVRRVFHGHVQYVVVDERMTKYMAAGPYFGIAAEPKPPNSPLPKRSLSKLDSLKWLKRVHTDGNIVIYQVLGAAP